MELTWTWQHHEDEPATFISSDAGYIHDIPAGINGEYPTIEAAMRARLEDLQEEIAWRLEEVADLRQALTEPPSP